MRVVVVWRDGEDYSRSVEEWIAEFERRTGKEVEHMSPDSREGEGFCQAYGIVEYPTILALNDGNGAVASMWAGKMLPTFDEVSYYS